ncbi:hypothetical protein N867_05105, partial [Actinotalea fermentans ATCC 43279 = JCM 9966 = DSM 3133]
ASTELHDASQSLVKVGSESGLEGLAGDAATESFAQLARECAQLSLDLTTMSNVGYIARLAVQSAAAQYEALPPVELTPSQRTRVANAYVSQEPVYVAGHGMLSAWAAEQAWLAEARARREAEAADALQSLNAQMAEAAKSADIKTARDDDQTLLPPGTGSGDTGGSSTQNRPGGGAATGAGVGAGAGAGAGASTGGIGGGPIAVDPPVRDWSDISADGSTGGTGGRTGSGGGIGGSGSGLGGGSGSGSSGGGSWGGPGLGGSGSSGGAGGALAGGAAVGGVAVGALGLGRGGLGIGGLGMGAGGAGG